MTIDRNGIPGVIAWLLVCALFWFAMGLNIPFSARLTWKTLAVMFVSYLVFFYAFR